MEISKSGFDSLPKEIVQQILSYLDQSTVRATRATNRLFRALLFSTDFVILQEEITPNFADVCDRLLKYYSTTLISLRINPPGPVDSGDLLENISKLSNLSALQTRELFVNGEDLLKLTDLTNLNKCSFARDAPSSLIPYWSNLTYFDCGYSAVRTDFPFSELRALKKLLLTWPDADLSNNTNLTWLVAAKNSSNSTISNLVKLRHLNMALKMKDSSFLASLTDLEELHVDTGSGPEYAVDSQFLRFINSNRLTHLYIAAYQQIYYRDLSRLTNLKYLTIYEHDLMEPTGRINMSVLTNLTSIRVQTKNIHDFEEISKLTKLKVLSLEVPRRSNLDLTLNASLSALTNLEELCLLDVCVSTIESDLCFMKNLTDLIVELNDNSDYKFLEIAPIKLFRNQMPIQSGQFWSNVTKCTTLESLIHSCDSPDGPIICSLTALSHLTQLSLRYTGQINQEYYTVLTSLRVLDFTPLIGGFPVASDWLREQMTWLEDYFYE